MMETITIKPKNKKDLKIILDLAKHLKAEVYRQDSPYDPEFVEKIMEGEKQFQKGEGVRMNLEDLWK